MFGGARRHSPLTLFIRDVASPSRMTDARKQAREQARKEAAHQNTRSSRRNPLAVPVAQAELTVAAARRPRPKPRPTGKAAESIQNPSLEVDQEALGDLETEHQDGNQDRESVRDSVMREETPQAWHGEDASAREPGIVPRMGKNNEGEDEDEGRIREEDEMEHDHRVSSKCPHISLVASVFLTAFNSSSYPSYRRFRHKIRVSAPYEAESREIS
jgi:hypothetical protein